MEGEPKHSQNSCFFLICSLILTVGEFWKKMTSEWESEIVEVVARAVREEWGTCECKKKRERKDSIAGGRWFFLKMIGRGLKGEKRDFQGLCRR